MAESKELGSKAVGRFSEWEPQVGGASGTAGACKARVCCSRIQEVHSYQWGQHSLRCYIQWTRQEGPGPYPVVRSQGHTQCHTQLTHQLVLRLCSSHPGTISLQRPPDSGRPLPCETSDQDPKRKLLNSPNTRNSHGEGTEWNTHRWDPLLGGCRKSSSWLSPASPPPAGKEWAGLHLSWLHPSGDLCASWPGWPRALTVPIAMETETQDAHWPGLGGSFRLTEADVQIRS